MAGEPAARSAAFGRVNAQEKVGCWCTMVEGIEAEVKAAGLAENKVRKLLQASVWVLLAPRDGACALRARAADDFILWRPLLLLTAAAPDDSAALTRALLCCS